MSLQTAQQLKTATVLLASAGTTEASNIYCCADSKGAGSMDTDDLPAGQDALQQKLHQVQEELSRSVCYAVPCLLTLWPCSSDTDRMLCFFCFTR